MKIYTKPFASYAKLINRFYVKGSERGQSIYLDFQTGYAYMQTPKVTARLRFAFEGEAAEGFYVDIPTFLALCTQYPEIEYDAETGMMSYNGEEYKLAMLREDYDPVPFPTGGEPITLSSDISKKLNKAMSYMGADDGSLGCVHLGNHVIVATDREKMLLADVDAAFGKLDVPSYILSLVRDAMDIAPVNLYRDRSDDVGVVCFSIGDADMDLMCPEMIESAIPDNYDDDEFKQVYNHDTNFVVDKHELYEVFRFLDPFAKSVPNERILLTISDNELTVEVKEDVKAKRILALKEISEELDGCSFYVARPTMLLALSSIMDDMVRVRYADDYPAYCVTGETKTDNNVVIVNMQ